VPSLLVANEIFVSETYSKPVGMVQPKTFLDLGANVGYFPLLVAEVAKSREVKGLSVEPNPQLQPLIEAHLTSNHLNQVHLIKGVAAGDQAGTEVDFFVNPSHIASSISGNFNPLVPVGGRVEKIKVPVVDLDQEWRRYFGDERIDLLKVDIEGAEIPFLTSHRALLEKVGAILIEWHKWATSLDEVSSLLGSSGFALTMANEDGGNTGTALFRRTQ
jgi:FkbM family methyltransferase